MVIMAQTRTVLSSSNLTTCSYGVFNCKWRKQATRNITASRALDGNATDDFLANSVTQTNTRGCQVTKNLTALRPRFLCAFGLHLSSFAQAIPG